MAPRPQFPIFIEDNESESDTDEHEGLAQVQAPVNDGQSRLQGPQVPSTISVKRKAEVEAVDVDLTSDDYIPMYSFKTKGLRPNHPIPINTVFPRLRNKYAEICARQAENAEGETASDGGQLRQRLEEMFNTVPNIEIGHLIDRDERFWKTTLDEQRDVLKKEVEQIEKFLKKITRPSSCEGITEGILKNAKERLEVMEKDLGLRRKLIAEMKRFSAEAE